MDELKQQLVEVVEAYASARVTNNPLVVRTMGQMLMQLIESLEIVRANDADETATANDQNQ